MNAVGTKVRRQNGRRIRAYRYKDVDAINYVPVEARIVAAIVIGIILSYGIDTRNVLPSSASALMNCAERARFTGTRSTDVGKGI